MIEAMELTKLWWRWFADKKKSAEKKKLIRKIVEEDVMVQNMRLLYEIWGNKYFYVQFIISFRKL